MPNLASPPNSEVPEHFLMMCAGVPAAMSDIQLALQKDKDGYRKLEYDEILTDLKLEELVSRAYVHRFLVLTLSFCLKHSGQKGTSFFCMALAPGLRGRPHVRFRATVSVFKDTQLCCCTSIRKDCTRSIGSLWYHVKSTHNSFNNRCVGSGSLGLSLPDATTRCRRPRISEIRSGPPRSSVCGDV
jgi:hypothetical protein